MGGDPPVPRNTIHKAYYTWKDLYAKSFYEPRNVLNEHAYEACREVFGRKFLLENGILALWLRHGCKLRELEFVRGKKKTYG